MIQSNLVNITPVNSIIHLISPVLACTSEMPLVSLCSLDITLVNITIRLLSPVLDCPVSYFVQFISLYSPAKVRADLHMFTQFCWPICTVYCAVL